ncbi:MAG: phosphoribosylanthranilate isomerase [Gemmatimonadota bacterium]
MAGAHYIGVILAPGRARSQSLESAEKIYARAPGLRRVGVFADQPIAEIVRACERLKLDVLQLHGSEPSAFVSTLQRRVDCTVWKKTTVATPVDVARAVDTYADVVNGLLLDAAVGGSGRTFEWSLARDARSVMPPNVQLIVAGGLNPDNVRAAIAIMKPDVVDVASGVEQVVGEKSKDRIDAFVRNALR